MKEYAVVTGASTGIGKEFARELARRGVSLVLVARSEEKLSALAKELHSEFGVDAVPLALDLANPEGRKALFSRCDSEAWDVSYLVNAAGYGSNGHFTELDLQNEIRMTDLNCVAVQELTYFFAKQFLSRNKGTIVNIASTAAFQPVPFMATYAATKSFVLNFSMALRREFAGTGVSVFALCPGPVDTDFFRNAGMRKPKSILKVHPVAFVVRKAFKGIDAGKPFLITGTLNKVLYYLEWFAPLSMRAWTAGKMFGPRSRRSRKT